ncbi:MAG: NADH-quinone oxidoreductase subunit J [Deltaproteobacteria bacterium]|nr:NADH-quinone oxidoreductase subunit J [Deltaproteobacteria bacterium]
MEPLLFYFFGGLTVLAIVFMIFQANPVASALFLVFALFCLSALYVILSAPFIAILQVLVYAGAIMVLFIFVIMLLKLTPADLVEDRPSWGMGWIVLLGIGSVAFMAYYLLQIPANPFQPAPPHFGEAEGVGRLMFTKYLIPFELTSLLLLIAIVGVVLLGKKGEE